MLSVILVATSNFCYLAVSRSHNVEVEGVIVLYEYPVDWFGGATTVPI